MKRMVRIQVDQVIYVEADENETDEEVEKAALNKLKSGDLDGMLFRIQVVAKEERAWRM